MRKKIMLLGSGELGKEFTISAQRMGQYIIAVDSYEGAPAMQVAHESEVIDMLNAAQLDTIVAKHQPDIIVPEIEAIRTEQFYQYEKNNIQVVPSARAANFTMNRKSLRNLAAKDFGLLTANFQYANSLDSLQKAIQEIGFPCVIKPLMSSSGKGQSVIKTTLDIENAWKEAGSKGRGDSGEVIVEAFVDFDFEITLLTVSQINGPTLFCPPIGHVQENGDYQQSWQPQPMSPIAFEKACNMAKLVTQSLGGAGLWGVEFFIKGDTVYFSELSPRPHDTGMVTLAGTQNFSEFELHCRAILGLPIPEITLLASGASSVILATKNSDDFSLQGLESVLKQENTDFRWFGKPTCRPGRRMGVILVNAELTVDIDKTIDKAKSLSNSTSIQT